KYFIFMIYIFGAILVFTAYKMMTSGEGKIEPEKNHFVRAARKVFPVDTESGTDHFFVKKNHKLYATVAFITLVLVESTDVIFAIDSIPAVLAITHDPFIAITSNLFAILGLRSLFFALAGILNLFRYLKYGISFILLFVGVKMLISGFVHIPVQISLLVIVATLAISVLASVVIKEVDEIEKKEARSKKKHS
ncbi:MAG: TerC family protein, partial [Ignavibacteria bacterium]|nr:TerC family protein [Ignavibacteria bacterium]